MAYLYGAQDDANPYASRSVLAVEEETTGSGNIVISAGFMIGVGWKKSEHVVLTPDEVANLIGRLANLLVTSADVVENEVAR